MLKFAGIPLGTKIRAYDFKPSPDREDCYVEGVIKNAGKVNGGVLAYTISVTKDTIDARKFVCAPYEVGFMEWDGRITVLETE